MTAFTSPPPAVTTQPAGGAYACSCGGRRWVEDQNWSPDYPETWRGERTEGNGLIPCGLCNHGGWDVEPGPRHWVVRLPLDKPLSLNDRSGWQKKHRVTAQARKDCGWAIRAARIPALPRARVELHYVPAVRRHRDSDNLAATHKVAVDALRDAGVLAGDTPEYVDAAMPVLDPVGSGRPGLYLHVSEAPSADGRSGGGTS